MVTDPVFGVMGARETVMKPARNMIVTSESRCPKRRAGRSEMGAQTFEWGQKVRNLIGVSAVSLVAMFGAALVPVSTASGANATSNYFAGYQATSLSGFGSASVKFRVPAVQCQGPGLAAIGSFVGDLHGVGRADVLVLCDTAGVPSYFGGPNESNAFAPRPGDLVKTTVSVSSTANKATFTDLTQGFSDSGSFASSSGPTVVYDGVNTAMCVLHCGFSYVANFGKLRMFDATLNGVSPRTAGATAFNLQYGPDVATSALSATGNAWTEVWKNP
jgi:hypothetical protein